MYRLSVAPRSRDRPSDVPACRLVLLTRVHDMVCVQEMLRPLEQHAVALLNVDNLHGNSSLSVKAVPLLYRALARAAGRVRSPRAEERARGRASLLQSWLFHSARGALPGDRTLPRVEAPLAGSDFWPFLQLAGLPVADLRLHSAPLHSSHTLYHTALETAWALERLLDPSGGSLRALGQFWLELARDLADSPVSEASR